MPDKLIRLVTREKARGVQQKRFLWVMNFKLLEVL